MDDHSRRFNWIQFAEGRARFAGDIRGADELGHETFAVEVRGSECFGELDKVYLPDRHSFNIEIISFGYRDEREVGMPMPSMSSVVLGIEAMRVAQRLITELITAGKAFAERPFVLTESEKSSFTGRVLFRDGWTLVQ